MKPLIIAAVLLLTTACNTAERITRLEQQNQELRAQLTKEHAVADYDLQGKCSHDAKVLFKEQFSVRPVDATLLDYTNHYSKSWNKCFLLIEYHYQTTKNSTAWVNLMSLYDVQENGEYGAFGERHSDSVDNSQAIDSVTTCRVTDKKCTSIEEFNSLVKPYMND